MNGIIQTLPSFVSDNAQDQVAEFELFIAVHMVN